MYKMKVRMTALSAVVRQTTAQLNYLFSLARWTLNGRILLLLCIDISRAL